MSEYIISDEQVAENQRLKGRMLLVMPVVVRCRDCANYHDGISQYTGRRFAEPHCLAIGELAYGALFEVSENDYCSWAERRER